MANHSRNVTRKKIGLVAFVLCAVCSAVLVGRLFYLQIVDGDRYKQLALNQQLKDTVIEPHRGSIYDTNMKTLATSKTVWDVVFEPANLSNKEEKREEELKVLCDPATGLPSLIDVTEETIRKKAENVNSYWEVLQYKVDKETADAIELFIQTNGINCITLNQGSKRVYPFDDLAASVLGFVNAYDNRGAYGLESYYNKILTGSEGRIVSAKNGQNGEMPFQYEKLYESQDGNSLVLTIDEVIQHFVEKHLEIAVVEHDVKKRATGIVMDVDTGKRNPPKKRKCFKLHQCGGTGTAGRHFPRATGTDKPKYPGRNGRPNPAADPAESAVFRCGVGRGIKAVRCYAGGFAGR